MKKTFKKEDIWNVVWGDADENSPLVLEDVGKWESGGKYQYQEHILMDTATGKFYIFRFSRTGPHFTEYTYNLEWLKDEIELTEVVKSTRSVVVWIPLKV